jgi:tetratricopeptide (TPR) repeat protein
VQRNQYLLIGVALLVVAALYFFGNIQGNKNKAKSTTSTEDGHQHDPMNPTSEIKALDIDSFKNATTAKLSASLKAKIEQLTSLAEKENTAVTYKDVAEFWEKQNELTLAAKYYKKAAFLENTEKSITFAGNLLMAILQKTEDPSVRKWQALEAIECYTKALEINPDNVDTKIALATCYTEGTGETMKGVTLLREVTAKDSTNISANIILGKMAIQSGQLDKAIKRLELVLSLRPDNTEAMYFLAEAYKGQGNKTKAIELFEQCKKMVNSPEFSNEIDNYIKTFK